VCKIAPRINPKPLFLLHHICVTLLVSTALGFAFGFFYGLSEAKVQAALDYTRPEQFLNVSCWTGRQMDIVHPGRMHFIYLVEENWSVDCGGFLFNKHPEGNHYFSTAPLRYTGRARSNCPHAYWPACYSTAVPTCESMLDSCYLRNPPNGVLLQVVNQNKQFFQALPEEEEEYYRKLVPDLSQQVVIFGSDDPEYYEEKYLYHQNAARALWVTSMVLQAVVVVAGVYATFADDLRDMGKHRHFALNRL
jgi:hypothetical protein